MSQVNHQELITEPGEDVYVFPASFAQQRLWFLDQFEPGSPFYNIPSAVRLLGKLDLEAFNRAVNEIVSRHEALRTTFNAMDGNPVQVIHPEMPITIPVIDIQHFPPDEKQTVAFRLANEEARRPFNISRGPLIRVSLVQVDEQEFIVLVTMHHIVSDGWSIGVLIYELSVLYSAFAMGKPSPLAELAIQYADFSEWQRDWLQGDVLENQINYWLDQLGGDIPVLELPSDRPRPPVITSRGNFFSATLPKKLTDEIKLLSQKEGATLFMILLAAYQVLLYRYTNQVDITVGSPIANRNRGELEALIGVFINTIVLRTNLAGNPTFRELLGQVKDVTLGAYSNQDVPFEVIVDKLGVSRDMSHSPLFQVMFILQNAPMRAQRMPGMVLEPLDVHSGTSTFDMTLVVAEAEEGLNISVEYNTDLFEAGTIQRMVGHYQTILEAVVENPDHQIAHLPIMRPAEQTQILVDWNATNDDFILADWDGIDRKNLCMHQLFELQACRTPDALAVVVPALLNPLSDHPEITRSEQITYRELDERANQLAHALIAQNVQPDNVVGVFMERSVDLIVSLLGILKSGAAYLPLDPMAPYERLAFIIKDATLISANRTPVILTLSHLVDRLPQSIQIEDGDESISISPKIIALDAEKENLSALPKEPLERGRSGDLVAPHNLVYLTYTSGSTGQSKGVMVEHQSLVNAYLAWEGSYELEKITNHLQMANFTFDVFSGDLVRALCSGGKLVICPREWLLAGERLYTLIQAEGIDIAEFVPAVLRNLIQYLEKVGEKLTTLRVLACGSDSWYVSEYRKFGKYLGENTRLINSFGLTEATIDSTYFEGSIDHLSDEQLVPIGKPFANTRIYILDEFLQPRPINIPGELFVGGKGVARGYHNRVDLNEEKFINSSLDLEGRLYRTGDMARYLSDGNIEFLGRLDDQLKIRGLRIEPGEIEAVLGSHPGVKETAVVAMSVSELDQRLVAFIVPVHQTDPPTTGDLRRLLQDRLPDYMVPSAFVFMDALPLNASGKIDRRSLSEVKGIDWSERLVTNEFVAPRTAVEEILVDLWAKILGVQKVGVYDNFFELGGHSLLATQLISRIRETFKVDLPLRSLFESPSIAILAENIEIAQLLTTTHPEAGMAIPALEPLQRDLRNNLPTKPVPLSFAQQRLWFLDLLEPNSPFYNLPEAVRLYGKLDGRVLEDSLNEVIRRHETLRTTFRMKDGNPVQVINLQERLTLEKQDLRHLPILERENAALQIAREEAQMPFNLATGPLLRARLLQLADEDHIVLLTLHHIVGDIWSSNILIQEVAVLYDAFANGRPSPLPDLRIQYADFATWQRNWLQGEVLQAQIDYWKNNLRGLPPLLELPTDRPRPAIQTFNGDYKTFNLSVELSHKIREIASQTGTTIFMTLLAAFNVLLARYSGQDDIAIGTPIANRTRGEIEGLIGFFVNTLVLRTDLSGEPSFKELLRRTREMSLGAYAHQDIPFEMIVDALQPERNLSHSPLFQVMFALQNAPRTAVTLPGSGLRMGPVDVHSGTAKFDLTLFMVDEGDARGQENTNVPGGQISGALEYNTDLFDSTTIERFIKHFEVLLTGIVGDPELSISLLPIMTEEEQKTILFEWNKTAASFPDHLCAHQLFELQVEQNSEAIALTVFRNDHTSPSDTNLEEVHYTYSELNRRANQLANYLQSQGVGVENLVGICAERSIELVVAILGVLKAGGAYVPLDPTYPLERLAYMLQDANAPVLLTQSHLAEQFMGTDLPDADGDPIIINARIICLDRDWQIIAKESEEKPESLVNPDNLAYVIYTSGSTGRPKGAMIEHLGLVNYLSWCQTAYPLQDGMGSPVHSSISFDLTVTSLISPLVSGKTAFLLPEGLGVELLSDVLKQSARNEDAPYSLIKITPAHLQLLGVQLSIDQARDRTKAFIIGGENLSTDHIQYWIENSPNTQLVNEYGPTETVVGCCVYWAQKSEMEKYRAGIVPIGRPIINTQLYILDEHLQPVPMGVSGELYIGGAGVGRGYLNRPELTSERFIPNPFELQFKQVDPEKTVFPYRERLYRSGDLARYLPDGNIECLGRVDFQVKIRGFRVELGEIEALLKRHPAVDEVVVWIWEEAGFKNLVAYIVPFATEDAIVNIGASELREFLNARLPDYMVPAAFMFLDELPLTPNGKVDRKALPKPDFSFREQQTGYVAPRTPQEEMIAGIWSEVLHVEQVGVFDNFFDLGGHSLLATQVISRINEAFKIEMPLRILFETPTVFGLTTQLTQATQEMSGIHIPPIVPLERDPITSLPVAPVPLSYAQQRLWVLDQLMPQSPLYNIPAIVQVDGPLNVAALEYGLNRVVERHEALRTVFSQNQGLPVQVVHMEQRLDIPVHDLRADPDRHIQARELAVALAMKPFNLENGPLIRMDLVQVEDEQYLLILNTHHIVSDDWSLSIFIRELLTYYQMHIFIKSDAQLPVTWQAETEGELTGFILPEIQIQYPDYAAWQRQWLRGEALEKQLNYWRECLSGLPPLLELPLDRPRPPIQTYAGAQVTFELEAEKLEQLRDLGRQNGATLFMTLLAAFQVLLYRYSGQEDLTVGTPIANRTRAELEGLIGFFVNTLVMRGDLSGEPSFIDLLVRVREAALGAYANQDLPFETLVDAINPQRDMSYHPLFQVMFVHQNTPRQMPGDLLGDLPLLSGDRDQYRFPTFKSLDVYEGIARFDLTLTVVEVPSEKGTSLSGSLEYNIDLFDRETIERMTQHLQNLIDGIIRDPSFPVKQVDYLSPEERQLILVDWAGATKPQAGYPEGRCVHELFDEWVKRQPDVPALVYARVSDWAGDDKISYSRDVLSYAELSQKANLLASYLTNLGVKPDTLVGICVDRSIEMVVGLLGILKAGGAYLPLDPSYPDDRLAYMISDSGIKILLTQEKLSDRLINLGDQDGLAFVHIDNEGLDSLQVGKTWDVSEYPVGPEHLAYVIYTSGSTGRPKGVLVEHKGLTNLVYQQIHGFGVDAHSRVLQFASFSFDASVSEIFMGLLSGGCLVLTPQETLSSIPELLEVMHREDVTTVTLPPSLLKVLNPILFSQAVPGFRTLISAGEAFPKDIASQWGGAVFNQSERRMINAYGPTEATIGPTYYRINFNLDGSVNGVPEGCQTIPIGKPIPNMEIYLLDAHQQPVPIGIAGEIYIGGVGLARAYLHQPELTREKFVPHPFKPGERLYRTGDLGKFLPDGNVEYLGRTDFQVKVRGYRIELGEIESQLSLHPQIKTSVVVVREDRPGDKRLVAYLVPETPVDSPIDFFNILREFLHERLPDYMIPAMFMLIDHLPLTPNGKVDRKVLPAPDQGELGLSTDYVPPSSELEKLLESIWAANLGFTPTENRPTIGVNDNFFELGGDSILGIQVIASANQNGLRLTPRHLFEYPTIAGLASVAENSQAEEFGLVAEDGSIVGAGNEIDSHAAEGTSADFENFGWSDDDLSNILNAIEATSDEDEQNEKN